MHVDHSGVPDSPISAVLVNTLYLPYYVCKLRCLLYYNLENDKFFCYVMLKLMTTSHMKSVHLNVQFYLASNLVQMLIVYLVTDFKNRHCLSA